MSRSINIKRIRNGRQARNGYRVERCALVSMAAGDAMRDDIQAMLERMRSEGSTVYDADGNEVNIDTMEDFFRGVCGE